MKKTEDEISDIYSKIIDALSKSKAKEVYCGALIATFFIKCKHAILPCGSMTKDKQDQTGLHNVCGLIINNRIIDIYVSRVIKIDDPVLYKNNGVVIYDLNFDPVELL